MIEGGHGWRASVGIFFHQEIIQIARAPVFNHIQSTWLQMMIEQVPKGSLRLYADMRGVIYDDVKPIGSRLISDLREKRFVPSVTLEDLNPLFGLKMFRETSINANNRATREIVSP